MAITLVGDGYIVGTNYQDQTITFGSTNWVGNSPQAGDIVVAILSQGSSSASGTFTINTSGYTSLTTNPINPTGGDRNSFMYCAYKIMGSTPDSSISVKGIGSTNLGKIIISVCVFRNINTTSPIDVLSVESSGTGTSYLADITTATDNSLIIATSALATVSSADYGYNGKTPTGYTLIRKIHDYSTYSTNLISAYKIKTPAGNDDPDKFPQQSSTSYNEWTSVLIALRPLSSGPANVKTINGLAIASVKTLNGLDIASIKTVNGLA